MKYPYWDRKTNCFHLDGNYVLRNVHAIEQCAVREGYCPIHTPSDHHMRDWPCNWRMDTQVLERICPHGIGHPDPDALEYHRWASGKEIPWQSVHGCDGCCATPAGGPIASA